MDHRLYKITHKSTSMHHKLPQIDIMLPCLHIVLMYVDKLPHLVDMK